MCYYNYLLTADDNIMAGNGRPKGSVKVPGSGRKKGTINLRATKAQARESFLEACLKNNFNPLAELIKIMDDLSVETKAKTLVQMLPYIWAPAKGNEAPPLPAFQMFANVDKDVLLKVATQAASTPPTIRPIQNTLFDEIEDDEDE